MYLADFEEIISKEYPEWPKAYGALKKGKDKLICNAVLDKDKQRIIIGVFKHNSDDTHWFLRKKDGTFLKGVNTSHVYITEHEFLNNVAKPNVESVES